MSNAYFRRLDGTLFQPTQLTSGAWNVNEQHVAPLFGLIAHAIERDHRARRPDPLSLCRLSLDILGTLTLDPFSIEIGVSRAGRTIELVEATVLQNDRPAVTARAWFAASFDTADIAGIALPSLPPPDDMAAVSFQDQWNGDCVRTIDVRRRELGVGHALWWCRTDVVLLEGEDISGTAYACGMLDFANGIAPRVPPSQLLFPNLDLTAHLFRAPVGPWIGFETRVSFGTGGLGLTHSTLHDSDGPLGTVSQILTIRPL